MIIHFSELVEQKKVFWNFVTSKLISMEATQVEAQYLLVHSLLIPTDDIWKEWHIRVIMVINVVYLEDRLYH